MVSVALGAEVSGQHQSSAARPRRVEAFLCGNMGGTDLTLPRQNGAIRSLVSCVSTVWVGSWQKVQHWGRIVQWLE